MADNTQPEQADRVRREIQFYDVKGDPRYEKVKGVIPHSAYYYYRKQHDLIKGLFLSKLQGKFLELGSTTWIDWLENTGLAPKDLTCINISEREIEKGAQAAQDTAVKPQFRLMDAHHLEFPDASFDVVFGSGILHHLEYEKALREVLRVLKPDGIMVFNEPLDMNPVGRLARRLNPEYRTEDEKPLRTDELRICSRLFKAQYYFEQFGSVAAGALSSRVFAKSENFITRIAFWLDERLVTWFPRLGPYYRYILIVGRP